MQGNCKDVLSHFKKRYFEKYGVEYKVTSYPKDLALIKNKLLKEYSFDDAIKIVDTLVENYELWNKNPAYKLGVHSFTSTTWLRDKAYEEAVRNEKRLSQMETDGAMNKEKTKEALQRILARTKGVK
ncbi:hypothetical protein P9695_14780 [Weizmannia sp. CD-2023]|uniref:hypothetical protein n=1 Tax=Heyndrickxia TaxID=2837504 RepID=UPI002E1AD4A7|nr:hypothetical protein [Weizmannia sp. CD-2023]MED4899762.1 hypothetical protein [Weizmannia sp. CD-2023]